MKRLLMLLRDLWPLPISRTGLFYRLLGRKREALHSHSTLHPATQLWLLLAALRINLAAKQQRLWKES